MNNKNIIIAGIAAIGLYLFSQQKKTVHKTPDIPQIKKMAEKMAAERLPPNASPTAEKELAEKIYADIMARRAGAARKKIPEKKAAAAAAAEKAAEKAAFTPEIKMAIAILSVAEKIQVLVAYRKKIAAEKNVPPESISLTPDTKARVLLEAAIEKASKTKVAPLLLDNSKKKKKKNKTPDDIKEKFGSWDTESEGQETSHKSTEPGYSKKKTKEEILKLFGLWALPTAPHTKSKLKPHIMPKKRTISKIRPAVRRLISARRSVSKPKWKPHITPKKRTLSKIRPAVRRLISARRMRLRRR